MNKKLIEIDIVILVILFALSGFGSWYFVKTQTDEVKSSSTKETEELNKKIEELEVATLKEKSCESPTKDLKPGEVTEMFLNMYMFGTGIGYNGIINTSKYDNYVTDSFKKTVKENVEKLKEGSTDDPILFMKANPENGFKVESEKISDKSATVVIYFDFAGDKDHKVEYSLVFDNELWKLDSNKSLD
ncbi:hypothetical protein HGB13_03930 [bacterium]|nr:hypothetical protein [bacterium]